MNALIMYDKFSIKMETNHEIADNKTNDMYIIPLNIIPFMICISFMITTINHHKSLNSHNNNMNI